MKIKTFFTSLILSLIPLTSCYNDSIQVSKVVTTKVISVSGYSGLKVANNFNLYVTFSDTKEGIRIEANENIQDKILVQKEGDDLIIKIEERVSIRGNLTLNTYITTKSLSKIDLSGSTGLILENEWVSQDAKIQLSGASRFSGELSVNNLELDLRGTSTADLFGKINLLTAELSGISEVRDYDLGIERLDIKLSGVSKAYVSVNESIDIEGSGKSELHYKGNAVIDYKRLSSGASIKNRN